MDQKSCTKSFQTTNNTSKIEVSLKNSSNGCAQEQLLSTFHVDFQFQLYVKSLDIG